MQHAFNKLSTAIAATILLMSVSAAASAGDFLTARDPIKGQYIVVLKENAARLAGESGRTARVSVVAKGIATAHQAKLLRSYEHVLRGFVVQADDKTLAKLIADPRVAYVEEDGIVSGNQFVPPQPNPTWGLDRIDQRALPLSNSYASEYTGAGVRAYVIDSGLRTSHTQFTGRVGAGFTAINDGRGVVDCHGHGTHVAGTLGGTTSGVAKGVTIIPVRVLDCTNNGATSGLIAGYDWVRANHIKPAVANISIQSSASSSIDTALANLVNAGVTVVVCAGNYNQNACNFSPARAPGAITVGSSDSNDSRSSFSNFGTCVDLFAPGGNITSAWYTGDSDVNTISGTSMAAPHVAGVAALYLQANPSANPTAVVNAIQSKSTIGVITNAGAGSPNQLLQSRLTIWPRSAFFRYYNSVNGRRLYTQNWSEVSAGGFGGWVYEGVPGYVSPVAVANTKALYRYNQSTTGRKYYTTNFAEMGNGCCGWVYESVAGYVPTLAAADTGNFYGYYNNINDDHFYTEKFTELGNGGFGGWIYEGVLSQIWTRH
jgi:serine protease